MPTASRVLAVDLGATSVRVASVDLAAATPHVEVLHRWAHGPVQHADGTLRWDWQRIVTEVQRGLAEGLARGGVASIGVDGWGVDYGLLDDTGRLVAPPYSYRDSRTAQWREVARGIGERRLYELTGVQLMPINTLFQLAAHERAELRQAERLLLLPDLLVRELTGHEGAERSNASTTGMLSAHTGQWAPELLDAIDVSMELLPPIERAGQCVGEWRGIPVHIVGSHDTASAFVAAPGIPGPGTGIVSSGTWVLAGTERPEAVVTEAARAANFSNEGGALGGVRLLKNIMGFWMLEQCRAGWGHPPVEELVRAAAAAGEVPIVGAGDERFLAPTDMEAEVRAAAGLPDDAGRDRVARCVLESIAEATGRVLGELGEVTGTPVTELLVVGGGVRFDFMNALYARRTGLPTTIGSPEATALGNAVVQGIAVGRFDSLDSAREWVATAGRVRPL